MPLPTSVIRSEVESPKITSRPVVVSREHMAQISAHLVRKVAQEVAEGAVQTKRIDDVEAN